MSASGPPDGLPDDLEAPLAGTPLDGPPLDGDDEDEGPRLQVLAVEDGGQRLDAFLIERLRPGGHSRAEIQAWIRDGRVRISRAPVHAGAEPPAALKAAAKLRAGDEVVVCAPPPPPPPGPLLPEAIAVPIIYQDDVLLVLDKPPGLTVHPGAGQRDGTLVNALLHLSPGALSGVGGAERPGIVHRLDKDTSGVIVVARTDAAHRALARQFHDRVVSKRYQALTDGVPRPAEGLIDRPLGRHPKDRKRMAVVEGGRAARTQHAVREAFAHHAWVECRPETGRTHQLRVHLRSLGTPILADATYGRAGALGAGVVCAADLGGSGDAVVLRRQALHASRLELVHPRSGERVAFEAPLPADFQAALELLRAR